jgi:hypothetical protein
LIDKSGRAQIRTGSLRPRNGYSPRSLRRPTISAISAVAELAAAITGWPTTSGVYKLRVSLCNRLGVFTVSPITVNEKLCSLPISPSTAGP